jgi:DNA topoisomerase IB
VAVRRKRVADAHAALDPPAAAKLARLHHTTDDRPGITRHKARSGFNYRQPDGALISDFATLQRIKALVIPPAWTAVWINPDPLGHIQVTGRDRRGRKQYRYHSRWREVRDEAKYGKMLLFARVLPLIRVRVDADLRRHGLPCERVLAAIVRLLELTLFRVGNDEYARTNNSFGLTTLRDRHAQVQGGHIRLSFRGKSGSRNEGDINDPRLARIVKACRDLPGYELFQYLDASLSELDRGKCLSSRDHRRGYHCKRLSHLGGHQPRRARATRVRTCRQRCHAQTRRCARSREGRKASRTARLSSWSRTSRTFERSSKCLSMIWTTAS